MSGNTKKWLAVAGGILVALCIALMQGLPDNKTIHTVCEIALKFLALVGFTAPVSIMNPDPKQ
jgi:hypothetical protein